MQEKDVPNSKRCKDTASNPRAYKIILMRYHPIYFDNYATIPFITWMSVCNLAYILVNVSLCHIIIYAGFQEGVFMIIMLIGFYVYCCMQASLCAQYIAC